MEQSDKIMNGITHAIGDKNAQQLRTHSLELSTLLLEYDNFPEKIFTYIIDLIQSPQFIKMQESYILLNDIFDDLDSLSNEQQDELKNTLVSIYDKVEDSTTCMVILEIIVDNSKHELAINILNRLKTIKTDVPRAIVAYGLYYFIKECHDELLNRNALTNLAEMQNDPSVLVRKEVEEALMKLHGNN